MHGERPDEESCLKNTVVSVRDRRFHRISTTWAEIIFREKTPKVTSDNLSTVKLRIRSLIMSKLHTLYKKRIFTGYNWGKWVESNFVKNYCFNVLKENLWRFLNIVVSRYEAYVSINKQTCPTPGIPPDPNRNILSILRKEKNLVRSMWNDNAVFNMATSQFVWCNSHIVI